MKNIFTRISGWAGRLVSANGRFIFTTLARILALCCLLVAAYFARKLSGQMAMH